MFLLPPGERIRITTFGFEEDGGLFDPSDQLPGFAVDVDPATAGQDFRITGGSDGAEFFYTIVLSFTTF
jgi:hypothetical protein